MTIGNLVGACLGGAVWRDDGTPAFTGISVSSHALVSIVAEGPGLGGWLAQELMALLGLVLVAVVIALLVGAIWLTFKGATDEVVIFEDWGDFVLSFGSVIVIFMGGGLIGASFEHGFSLVMLISGLCVGSFGLLLGWSSFELAFEHNGRGAFGVAVGVFKVVAGILIVLVLFENWKKLMAKDSTTDDRIAAGVKIVATGWLTHALVNGERVLAKRAAAGGTSIGGGTREAPGGTDGGNSPVGRSDDPIPLADSNPDGLVRVSHSPAASGVVGSDAGTANPQGLDAGERSATDRKPMTRIGVHKVRESARRVVIRTDGDEGERPTLGAIRSDPSDARHSASPRSAPEPDGAPPAISADDAKSSRVPDPAPEAPGANNSNADALPPPSVPSRSLPPRIADRVIRIYHVELADGSRFGPFAVAELRALVLDGRLAGDDLVIAADGAARRADELPGLFDG